MHSRTRSKRTTAYHLLCINTNKKPISHCQARLYTINKALYGLKKLDNDPHSLSHSQREIAYKTELKLEGCRWMYATDSKIPRRCIQTAAY